MHIAAGAVVIATTFLTSTLVGDRSYAQAPAPPPVSPPAGNAAQGGQAPAPTDFWTQEHLTGDWGGTRTRWKDDKGVDVLVHLTQFYQGISSGGVDTNSEYTGRFNTELKFDLGKFAGWEFWQAAFKTETRFGGPLVAGTGSINPVNTAALIPKSDGTVCSITTLNVTKLFPIDLKTGELFAVGGGRYNLVDLVDEDFFAGSGITRFFNIAQIGPLTVLRQVPLITNGISLAYIRGGEPFITFAIIDPNDHSTTTGLSDLFGDGVTFYPGINFPTKYFGKTGKHTFGGAVTTKAYTPFDAITQIIIPGPPRVPIEPQRGSWSINYVFRQYIVERGRRDGWGLFTPVSFADKETSPITTFFDVGIGGNGLFEGRPRDEFAIAYAFTDLSEVLKDNLDSLFPRLRPEHQVELFYNAHIVPWLRLTGDFQIIRPSRRVADTAVVPGARLEIVF